VKYIIELDRRTTIWLVQLMAKIQSEPTKINASCNTPHENSIKGCTMTGVEATNTSYNTKY